MSYLGKSQSIMTRMKAAKAAMVWLHGQCAYFSARLVPARAFSSVSSSHKLHFVGPYSLKNHDSMRKTSCPWKTLQNSQTLQQIIITPRTWTSRNKKSCEERVCLARNDKLQPWDTLQAKHSRLHHHQMICTSNYTVIMKDVWTRWNCWSLCFLVGQVDICSRPITGDHVTTVFRWWNPTSLTIFTFPAKRKLFLDGKGNDSRMRMGDPGTCRDKPNSVVDGTTTEVHQRSPHAACHKSSILQPKSVFCGSPKPRYFIEPRQPWFNHACL